MELVRFLPLIFVLITVPLIILTIYMAQRSRKKRVSTGVFKDHNFKTQNKGQGKLDNVEYTYIYHAGSRNSPPFFKITIPCTSLGSFKLSRESSMDRFFKRFGLNAEIQTGDPEFDDQFYITTNDTAWTRLTLHSRSKRRAALDIASEGFNEIRATGKILTAKCSPLRSKEQITKAKIERIASRLIELSKELPPAGSVPRNIEDSNWKLKRGVVFGLALMSVMGGGALLALGIVNYRPMDFFPLFLYTLKYSLPLLIGFLILSIMFLRGRASSHREFIFILIITLTGFPLLGLGLGVYLNGYLDHTQEMVIETEVLNKTISRSDNSTSYYAIVRSWRRPGTEKIRVNSEDYRKLRPRDSELIVVTQGGRYGFEWIRGVKIYE